MTAVVRRENKKLSLLSNSDTLMWKVINSHLGLRNHDAVARDAMVAEAGRGALSVLAPDGVCNYQS